MQRGLFFVCLLGAVACRERDPVCGADGCVEARGGAGGQAGSGGTKGDAGAGAGGRNASGTAGENASGEAGSAGDGGEGAGGAAGAAGERAEAGAGGEAPSSACGECAPGLTCVEGAGGASCEYPNPGRWLVFSGNDGRGELPVRLRALRLEGTKPSASVSLSDGEPGDYFQGESWSRDGRHLIAFGFSYDDLSTNTLLHIEFGAGLPTPRGTLPGLPVSGGAMQSPVWASDSSRLLIQNVRPSPEIYLVAFSGSEVSTELLFRDEEAFGLSFCENPRWFIRQINGETGIGETRLVDSEDPSEETPLWPGLTYPSPDGHFLIATDYDTGLWRGTCEADPEVERLGDRGGSGFEWSADSRFVVVAYGDGDYEIEALDALDEFRAGFTAYTADHNWPWSYRWSPAGSRLVVFGASESGGACEVLDVDLGTTPRDVKRRGGCPETLGGEWGVLENGAIWTLREDAEAERSLWLLEPGADVWRSVATGLHDTSPYFTPEEGFAVFNDEKSDGTIQTLAFPLNDPEPSAIRLEPAPAPYVTFVTFHAGGVILNGGESDESPYSGQLWWAPLGSSGFGPAVPLVDVSYAASPRPQPER